MAATNFNVYFYNFTKKVNSTRTPVNGTEGLLWEVHTCYLRSPSSIIAPVLEMSFDRNQYGGDGGVYNENIGEGVLEYNYAYIPRFNRYYFINNISWDNGMFILNLKCDVLGTYKTAIGNYTGFVVRASAANDSMIEDTFRTVNQLTSSGDAVKVLFEYSPTYIFGCNCHCDAPSFGGLTYFAGSESAVSNMLRYISGGWEKVSGSEYVDATPEDMSVLQPLNMIKSLSVVPFALTGLKAVGEIYYNGFHRPNTQLNALTTVTRKFDATIKFGSHPQKKTLKYTAYEPYTQHFINLPGVGVLKMNSDEFIGDTYGCSVAAQMDLIQGNIQYALGFPAGLYTYDGCLGIGGSISGVASTGGISAVQHTGSMINTALGVLTIGAGAAMAATSGGLNPLSVGTILSGASMASTGVISGIGNAAGTAATYNTTISSSGSRARLYNSIMQWSIFKNVSNIDATSMGYPVCNSKKISTIPGYILMKDASVDIPGTEDEMKSLNMFLNTGFYYEEDVT